jgi:membrane peptidoglycan carboxypeptidase
MSKELDKKVAETVHVIKKLAELYRDGKITQEEYNRLMDEELESKLEQLKKEYSES